MHDKDLYPCYALKKGRLIKIEQLDWWDNFRFNLHHYVKKQEFDRNKDWFDKNGIKQKLILMSIKTHEHLHHTGIRIISDEEFLREYRISRDLLFFNKDRYFEQQGKETI